MPELPEIVVFARDMRCGTAVVKVKTGSTSSYIGPACQPLGNGV